MSSGTVLGLWSPSSACALQSMKGAWWVTLKDLVSVVRRVATAALFLSQPANASQDSSGRAEGSVA